MQPMPSEDLYQTFTYQTRLKVENVDAKALDQCAEFFSILERKLFADISSGKKAIDLKSHYIKQYQITARHFNALRVQVEGKIASIQERQKLEMTEKRNKIEAVQNSIHKMEKKDPHSNRVHQKKRLLSNLKLRLEQIESDQQASKVRLCFGSKRLFRAQFDLVANGYKSHEEWLADWQKERNNSFFLLGSKDESSGNQSCTAAIAHDGSFILRIRLPDNLGMGKYLTIPNVRFEYGHRKILAALHSCEKRKQLNQLKNLQYKEYGLPITYRFKRDHKSWKVFISVPVARVPKVTSTQKGVIGIDINANHLAISEADRFGNPIKKNTIKLNTYGKNQHQTRAAIGDVCSSIIEYAKKTQKTIVIENLDFQRKKSQLKEQNNPIHSRLLSSFAYGNIKNCLYSRGWKEGVKIAEVNPAYTSVIGRIKFAKRYGLSVHQAAALAIGRRYLKFSERIPSHLGFILDGKNGHVALSLPVRNRDQHVWTSWKKINQELKTVLAAHFRAIKNRSRSLKPP
jgi:IS605 OrfB family transposase